MYKFAVLPLIILASILLVANLILGLVELISEPGKNEFSHHWTFELIINVLITTCLSIGSCTISRQITRRETLMLEVYGKNTGGFSEFMQTRLK